MTKKTLLLLASCLLVACSSSGPIATGKDTYMITKQSAGGLLVSGASVKAEILTEANQFCAKNGKTMELTNSEAKNAIPFARMPSAEIEFRCN
jgi:uncharacterized protein YcfL